MKIYNKKGFLSGAFLTLLGVSLICIVILGDFTLKRILLSALCLYFGIETIIRSVSKELSKKDKLEKRDERNILVTSKAQSTAFQITRISAFVLGLLFVIASQTSATENITFLGVGLLFASGFALLAELICTIYYEIKC